MRYSQLLNFARNGAVDFIVDLADAMALQNLGAAYIRCQSLRIGLMLRPP